MLGWLAGPWTAYFGLAKLLIRKPVGKPQVSGWGKELRPEDGAVEEPTNQG